MSFHVALIALPPYSGPDIVLFLTVSDWVSKDCGFLNNKEQAAAAGAGLWIAGQRQGTEGRQEDREAQQ